MENAPVGIIEDNAAIRHATKRFLELTSSHRVISEASTLQEGLAMVDAIARGELDCQVLVLDGNLDSTQVDGSDARAIVERVRAHELGVKIIGFSGYSMQRLGVEVDIDLGKDNYADLGKTIDAL